MTQEAKSVVQLQHNIALGRGSRTREPHDANNTVIRIQPETLYGSVKSAVKTYENIKTRDASGKQPMYRLRGWRSEERAKQKRKKRESWYNKGGHDSGNPKV